MSEIFTNNAKSTLAAGITASATSVTLQTGDGAKFPNPGAPDFFRLALFKKSTGEIELCTCSARSGDVLTIVRAQEGTTAIVFNANDVIELRPTAAFFNSLSVTSVNIQDNSFKKGTDTGVANSYVITPTPTVVSYSFGLEFIFDPANTNTGASTLNVSGLGNKSIKLIDGSDPAAGALTAGRIAHVIYDGSVFVLVSLYPAITRIKGLTNVSILSNGTITSTNTISASESLLPAGNGKVGDTVKLTMGISGQKGASSGTFRVTINTTDCSIANASANVSVYQSYIQASEVFSSFFNLDLNIKGPNPAITIGYLSLNSDVTTSSIRYSYSVERYNS